ncbi:uncharacterized protein V6R79_006833 [Siganus canaliculatus]
MEMSQMHWNYQSVSPMDPKAVKWRRFFVKLAGNTDGAHKQVIRVIKALNQSEVKTPEASDYFVVVCPVLSQVERDVCVALQDVPGDKPTIVVVLHDTMNSELLVAPSRQLINKPNVYLTVDFLSYGGKIHECNRNKLVWLELAMFFSDSYRARRVKIVIIILAGLFLSFVITGVALAVLV